MEPMLVGERRAELRRDLGKTQKEVAAELHITTRTYGDYEREITDPPDAIKISIAEYFNVSLDYLLGVIDRPRPIKEDNRYIRLPQRLPEEKYKELKAYMQFLISKDK